MSNIIPEYKIGDTFNYKGITLKVERANEDSCENCYFHNKDNIVHPNLDTGSCSAAFRTDHKNIIFKKNKIN